jgi:mono/diheme cytochrome c family protein
MTNAKSMASGRSLFFVALGTIAAISLTLPAPANAADADAGKQTFQEKCVACHTVGGGDLVGPDLKGVTTKRPRDWLEQWIAAPDAMIAKKDPIAIELLHKYRDVPMPNLGLSAADVTAVLAYLETASGQPSAPATASAPEVQGNPEIGKELFTGVLRFRNGGPPCMACHSAAGIGALGGGQLGPDLTDVVTRLNGAPAVNAFLTGMPTPTMKAVWSQHPPTPEERASVVSFLGQAGVTQRPAQAIWQLAALAGLGLLILLAVGAFNWRNRLRFGVRRPMVGKLTTGATNPRNGGWFTGTYHPGWHSQFKK